MNIGIHGKIKKIEYDFMHELFFRNNICSKYKKNRLFWQIGIKKQERK